MASSTGPDSSEQLATAVGEYVLGELSLGKAAEQAGVTRWEFEEILRDAGFEALYGPRTDDALSDEVDTVREFDV